jgi:hypothetical protein
VKCLNVLPTVLDVGDNGGQCLLQIRDDLLRFVGEISDFDRPEVREAIRSAKERNGKHEQTYVQVP